MRNNSLYLPSNVAVTPSHSPETFFSKSFHDCATLPAFAAGPELVAGLSARLNLQMPLDLRALARTDLQAD